MDEKDEVDPQTLYKSAVEILRFARTQRREATDTELREHVKGYREHLFDDFILSDGFLNSTGTGYQLTRKGRLYLRMVDGIG